jgi:hypothetical protein
MRDRRPGDLPLAVFVSRAAADMTQSPCNDPPGDCPPGLWKELCELIRHPEEFIRENPECYEELKRCWAQTASSSRTAPPAGEARLMRATSTDRPATAAFRASRG